MLIFNINNRCIEWIFKSFRSLEFAKKGLKMNVEQLQREELPQLWADTLSMLAWASTSESLVNIGRAVDMELKLISKEHYIGLNSSRIDLVCRDTNANQIVIIKCQPEALSDQDLGLAIRTTAALNAGAIIWLAKDVGEDFIETIHWLNEYGSESVSFYALQGSVVSLGNAYLTPYLQVIAKPSRWKRAALRSLPA